MSMVLTVVITEEDGIFIAVNPDTDVASQGETMDEAIANLREALSLYFEESDKKEVFSTHPSYLTTITI